MSQTSSIVVAIDGPAGAGKSSVARLLAKRLGYQFLDTGAMYRAATLAVIEQNMAEQPDAEIAELVSGLKIEPRQDGVFLNGKDVTEAIRTPSVARQIYLVADNPAVRAVLVETQREIGLGQNTVTEGRDQGTVVFPDSPCKFFLTASPEERARRRQMQLAKQGQDVPLEEVLADQEDRDQRDAARPVGGLRRAEDAVEVITDGMSQEDVVEKLVVMIQERLKTSPNNADQ